MSISQSVPMVRHPAALRTAAAGCIILIFSMGVGRFAFTPLLPLMQAEGSLDVEAGGILASVHFIGYAMGALLAGYLTGAPKLTLFACLSAIGLATGVMGLTDCATVWLVARWGAGVCSALVLVIVSNHFLKHLAACGRPELAGWVFAGVGTGTALVGLGTLWLMVAGAASWAGWLGFGIATLAATAALFALVGNGPFMPAASSQTGTGGGTARLEWRIILPYGMMGAGYIVPATYLPVMGQQAVSSPHIFGWSWPLFGFAAALSTLVGARLHKRYSNRSIWAVSQTIMALGLLLPALSGHIWAVVAGGICVGGTFMVITVAGLKEAHRLAAATNPQRPIAALTAAFALGQIAGPPAAGWAYDLTQSFAYPLILASLLLFLTLLPMLTLARHERPQV